MIISEFDITYDDMIILMESVGLLYDERIMVITQFSDGMLVEMANLCLDYNGNELILDILNNKSKPDMVVTKEKKIISKWNKVAKKKLKYHDNIELLRNKL